MGDTEGDISPGVDLELGVVVSHYVGQPLTVGVFDEGDASHWSCRLCIVLQIEQYLKKKSQQRIKSNMIPLL